MGDGEERAVPLLRCEHAVMVVMLGRVRKHVSAAPTNHSTAGQRCYRPCKGRKVARLLSSAVCAAVNWRALRQR
jgi:hypothetical protein